jgi:membrane associated rhomboid family serine protease
MAPLTKAVKILLGSLLGIWFVVNIIIEQFFMKEPKITLWLALTPYTFMKDYLLWQPLTYLFVQEPNPISMVFNLLILWWLGSELERLWGTKFFTLYFFVCGIGTAILYSFVALSLSIATSQAQYMLGPVIGVSSALFGLMVAYGRFFGDRVVYFMFFFPMKSRLFMWVLIGIELVLVLNSHSGLSRTSSLSHLGGALVGYIFLWAWPRMGGGPGASGSKKRRAKNLRLVVNNTSLTEEEEKGPKYWH